MTLDEALIIAQRIEDDQVVGPVGQAIRVLLADYKELQQDYYEYFGFEWRTF